MAILMVNLSNEDLHQCFLIYHQALYDEKFYNLDHLVLTIKYSQRRNLRILVERSFTAIYYVKLDIEYAYRSNVFMMEQQRLRYGGVILDDTYKLKDTRIFHEVGNLDLEMSSVDFGVVKLLEEERSTANSQKARKTYKNFSEGIGIEKANWRWSRYLSQKLPKLRPTQLQK